MSTLKVDNFPPVNNAAVFQTGRSTFTLKHPNDPSGLTVPTTISVASIHELFNHHDAILKLKEATTELRPEPFAWDKFTHFWNFHAAEDGPRFVVWDAETGIYLQPLRVVTLADLNLTRRIPKITSDAAKASPVDAKLSKATSNMSTISKSNSVATTTTTTTISSSSEPSIVDFLPRTMSNDLFTTSMARYIHQEKRQEAYRNERERKRQAKDAERRKEKKQKKKHHKKKLTDARQVLDDDVTMSSPTDASQPSTSSTIAK